MTWLVGSILNLNPTGLYQNQLVAVAVERHYYHFLPLPVQRLEILAERTLHQ